MKTSALIGHQGPDATGPAAQSAPRSLGFSADVTQLTDAAGPQPPRLSSALANVSASLGSFPAESSVSRLSMQPIAARRAGSVSAWQVQPEMRSAGLSRFFRKPRHAEASSVW